MSPLAPEKPLPVEHPSVEKKKQGQDSPAGLVGANFIKMFVVTEQRRK
jgi:hypothetical protein